MFENYFLNQLSRLLKSKLHKEVKDIDWTYRPIHGFCFSQNSVPIMVELCGIEPQTSCVQSRRSPSWAIAPYSHLQIPLLPYSIPNKTRRHAAIQPCGEATQYRKELEKSNSASYLMKIRGNAGRQSSKNLENCIKKRESREIFTDSVKAENREILKKILKRSSYKGLTVDT